MTRPSCGPLYSATLAMSPSLLLVLVPPTSSSTSVSSAVVSQTVSPTCSGWARRRLLRAALGPGHSKSLLNRLYARIYSPYILLGPIPHLLQRLHHPGSQSNPASLRPRSPTTIVHALIATSARTTEQVTTVVMNLRTPRTVTVSAFSRVPALRTAIMLASTTTGSARTVATRSSSAPSVPVSNRRHPGHRPRPVGRVRRALPRAVDTLQALVLGLRVLKWFQASANRTTTLYSGS